STGERIIDGRSDIYSLACVLFELLAGEPPFTGASAQAVIAKRFAGPAPSVRVLRDGVPLAVDRAVSRALAGVPADRFDTAGEFVRMLESDERPALGRTVVARGAAIVAGVIVAAGIGMGILTLRHPGRASNHDSVAVSLVARGNAQEQRRNS